MKGVNTKEDVMKKAQEIGVEFIHMQFTDLVGGFKNVSITIEQLEKALNNEIMFDGSSIDGFVRIEESDIYTPTFPPLKYSRGSPAPELRQGLSAIFTLPTANPLKDVLVISSKKHLKKLPIWVIRCSWVPNANFSYSRRMQKANPLLQRTTTRGILI